MPPRKPTAKGKGKNQANKCSASTGKVKRVATRSQDDTVSNDLGASFLLPAPVPEQGPAQPTTHQPATVLRVPVTSKPAQHVDGFQERVNKLHILRRWYQQ